MTEGIDPSTQFRRFIEALNPLFEGDGRSKRLTKFTDVRLLPAHSARRGLSQSQSALDHSALALRPRRRALQYHPIEGLADVVVNGGLPFDLPAFKPFFSGETNYLPQPGDFEPYPGFLDAQTRYRRVKHLMDSIEGLSRDDVANTNIIPGDALIREFVGGSTIKIPHNE